MKGLMFGACSLGRLALITFLLTGCASTGSGIGTTVSECCVPSFSEYQNFSVVVNDAPVFLVPYVEAALTRALVEQGLEKTDSRGELQVTANFEQVNLKEEFQKDEFEGHLAPGGEFRFDAIIDIHFTNMATGEKLWSARLNRVHNIDVGEYMHKDGATNAIYQSITQVLKQS
jgi:hypothetical protein